MSEEKKAADKETVGNCKMLHSRWDRLTRDTAAALHKSKRNPNTVGSAFEKALEQGLLDGKELDEKLVGIETIYLTESVLTTEQVKDAAAWCTELSALAKDMQEKKRLLSAWFRSG